MPELLYDTDGPGRHDHAQPPSPVPEAGRRAGARGVRRLPAGHAPEGMAFSSAAADNLGAAVAARIMPFGDYGSGGRTVADSLLNWALPPTDGVTTARR